MCDSWVGELEHLPQQAVDAVRVCLLASAFQRLEPALPYSVPESTQRLTVASHPIVVVVSNKLPAQLRPLPSHRLMHILLAPLTDRFQPAPKPFLCGLANYQIPTLSVFPGNRCQAQKVERFRLLSRSFLLPVSSESVELCLVPIQGQFVAPQSLVQRFQ